MLCRLKFCNFLYRKIRGLNKRKSYQLYNIFSTTQKQYVHIGNIDYHTDKYGYNCDVVTLIDEITFEFLMPQNKYKNKAGFWKNILYDKYESYVVTISKATYAKKYLEDYYYYMELFSFIFPC